MGNMFLRAYEATNDLYYLQAARDVAMALVNGQLQSGGWDKRIEFDPENRKNYYYHVDENKFPEVDKNARYNVTTFDDDNTQESTRFLISFLKKSTDSPDQKDLQIRASLDYALKKIVEAQFPNGAWPQRWNGEPHDAATHPVIPASLTKDYPLEQPDTPYYGHYTFNDGALGDIIKTLIIAWKFTGDASCLESAKRGADFILLAQLPEPQPVWAQQYDAAMHPAWARAFEPPSVTGKESAGLVRLLTDIYLELGDEKYLEPMPKAINWFERSKLPSGEWARMYELYTNKPIYGDRDKKIHYTLAELSEERRNGYGWEGDFDVEESIAYYNDVTSAGRKKWLKTHPSFTENNRILRDEKDSKDDVKTVIGSLDAQNRWISKIPPKRFGTDKTEWVTTLLYIQNMNVLCDYLEKQ